jgi:hypothetical protein
VTNLEPEIERLYRLPPEEFVAARDELAARLKKGGDPESASGVKALRRPTVPAWAANQLIREQPEAIAELAKAGDELRRVQRRALSGAGAPGFREASARRRSVVTRLVEAALAILERSGRPSGTHRDELAATLEAASIDEDAMRQLQAGRLAKELKPPTEFDTFSALSVVPPAAQSAERAEPRPRTGRTKQERADARRESLESQLGAAHDQARARRREVQSADRKAERAAAEAARSGQEADKLEARAAQARERHRFLQERSRAAEQEARASREAAEQAEREATRLEKQLARGR